VRSFNDLPAARLLGENVLHEVVAVAHSHSEQVYRNTIAQQQGEAKENPGQVGRVEGQQTEEVHSDVRIPPCPDINQHYCEGLPQEEKVHEECKGDHGKSSEEEHHDEVGGFPPEAALLQHPTVAVGENHIEKKVETKCPEEQECGY